MAGGEAPDLSVVIVSFRSRSDLPACLAALPSALSGLVHEITLVDNHSEDGTTQWVRAEHPDIRVLENAENLGFAAAVNQGVAASRGRHVLLLNPDATPQPGSLAALVAALDADPSLGIAGPRLLGEDRAPLRSAWPEPGLGTAAFEALFLHNLMPRSRWHEARPDPSGTVPCLPGTCLAVRRDCFQGLGGLDARFFLYHEDFDLCLRAREAGWRVALVSEASCVHRVGGSAFQDRPAFVARFWESWRELVDKHHPGVRGRLMVGMQELGLVLRVVGHGVSGSLRGDPERHRRAKEASMAVRALRGRRKPR
jgi:N-acetylglucosaminyl-diphospho-decaprenol L-rhamnosyltransferase